MYRTWVEHPRPESAEPVRNEFPAEVSFGPQSCLFCHDKAWQWVRPVQQPQIPGPWALPDFVVTCASCEQSLSCGHRQALLERLEADHGPEAEELLTMFETQVGSALPRPA